jgi:hypothetical protein
MQARTVMMSLLLAAEHRILPSSCRESIRTSAKREFLNQPVTVKQYSEKEFGANQ